MDFGDMGINRRRKTNHLRFADDIIYIVNRETRSKTQYD